VGEPEAAIGLELAFDRLIELTAKRNADFYVAVDGNLRPV